MFKITALPESLKLAQNASALTGILRGIEREGLRVSKDRKIATTKHPESLGSALTHPYITTDFSEALLEFITPPFHRIEDLLAQLSTTQAFTRQKLDNEVIWSCSMPCVLNDDSKIPVAQYGSSNNAQLKTTYRIGLGNRYGRAMQTVAGLHYNFSLPNAFWVQMSRADNSLLDLQEYKDEKYFGLIRNFRRYYWLLIYLFGASPALCASFVKGRDHDLESFNNDNRTLHLPYATSLRMGDLGYQSSAQESLKVCYNNKHSYINSLCEAITQPIDEYEDIGLQDEHGNFRQLNTSLLQIENEFYSAIRPKRTAKAGETALTALCQRGVEYIEVRCLDVDPFSPLGITEQEIHFLDTFLLYCALKDSPPTSEEESSAILRNQKNVVKFGRKPGLELESVPDNTFHSLSQMATDLFEAMRPAAELLDKAYDNSQHTHALDTLKIRVEKPDTTPSAMMLNALKEQNIPYARFAMNVSLEHHETLSNETLTPEQSARFDKLAKESIELQEQLEQKPEGTFAVHVSEYYQQYGKCCAKYVTPKISSVNAPHRAIFEQ